MKAGRQIPAKAGTTNTESGYSLIEIVGVVAIVAILASLMASSAIKEIDQAAWTKETVDLNAMADALRQGILRTKSIPSDQTITTFIANELALPLNAITTTPRRYARAFLVDPNLRINNAALPYTQAISTNNARPQSARIMIVSSLASALPVATGIPSSADFNDIWDTAENSKPARWGAWAGRGQDLRIQRINLEPLFYHLVLVNRDTDNSCSFSMDSLPAAAIPLLAGPASCDAYYLDGSVLGLHDSAGVTATRYILKRDISFVFEREHWRGWIGPGDPYYTAADAFAREAVEFLDSDWNRRARGGASQTGVLVAMYVFMFNYALWADECPHFSRHCASGASSTQVPEYQILDSLGKNQAGGILFDASQELLNRSGQPCPP